MCLRIDCISPVKFALQRKKKKREFSRIWSCIRLWAKKIMVLETLPVFYSNTQPEKTLSWSLPAREGFHYHNTSMSLIKEKVKYKFRPWQKVIQVNLYLRPLKVQIYDCWTKDDAGYLHSQWHLFAEYSKEKKKLPKSSFVARCQVGGETWGTAAQVF